MTLTLNTASGVLHRSPRCAGRDTRFHWVVVETAGETLLGIQFGRGLHLVTRRCGKCLR